MKGITIKRNKEILINSNSPSDASKEKANINTKEQRAFQASNFCMSSFSPIQLAWLISCLKARGKRIDVG